MGTKNNIKKCNPPILSYAEDLFCYSSVCVQGYKHKVFFTACYYHFYEI